MLTLLESVWMQKWEEKRPKEYSLVTVNELLQKRLHYLLYLLEDHQCVASKQTTAIRCVCLVTVTKPKQVVTLVFWL